MAGNAADLVWTGMRGDPRGNHLERRKKGKIKSASIDLRKRRENKIGLNRLKEKLKLKPKVSYY